MFFPLTPLLDILITTFAVIGFVGVGDAPPPERRSASASSASSFVAGVYLTQDSLPVIGLLWNPRLLPFVYLFATC